MEFDESKIYTVLNADKVVIGSKGYFADDITDIKKQIFNDDDCEIETLIDIYPENCGARFINKNKKPHFLFYLIKEGQKLEYQPYKTRDELIKDFMNRAEFKGARFSFQYVDMFMQSVWVKRKDDGSMHLITDFEEDELRNDKVKISGLWFSMENLLEEFTYLDNSPCGKKSNL